MTTSDQILARIRRKIEIVRLDTKHRHDAIHYDMSEVLTLLNMLERKMNEEKNNGTA